MQEPLLRIQGISKQYHTHNTTIDVLRNINLNIYQGEILALLGPNGAGKSTLSSIIATLRPPTTGDIEFRGRSIYQDLIGYRRTLAWCPQKPNFEKMLTVKENLIFAGRYFGMSTEAITKKASELITQFELAPYADESPDILSKGFKQRLLFARALMHNPELIIIDEPTVGMDAPIRRQLWTFIKSLKEKGVTILLTTHYFEEVEALSDRVCILDRGEILLNDTPENLKNRHSEQHLEDIFIKLTDPAYQKQEVSL